MMTAKGPCIALRYGVHTCCTIKIYLVYLLVVMFDYCRSGCLGIQAWKEFTLKEERAYGCVNRHGLDLHCLSPSRRNRLVCMLEAFFL
ncbi:hypothetical protein BJX96DRAFT_95434 [Aspergillus floccosus]